MPMQQQNSKQSWSTKLLLKLHKIFNKSDSLFVIAPMITYMGPPNPHDIGDNVIEYGTSTPIVPFFPEQQWYEGIFSWVLGLLLIVVFIIGCVTVVRWIVHGIKHFIHKGNKTPVKK